MNFEHFATKYCASFFMMESVTKRQMKHEYQKEEHDSQSWKIIKYSQTNNTSSVDRKIAFTQTIFQCAPFLIATVDVSFKANLLLKQICL